MRGQFVFICVSQSGNVPTIHFLEQICAIYRLWNGAIRTRITFPNVTMNSAHDRLSTKSCAGVVTHPIRNFGYWSRPPSFKKVYGNTIKNFEKILVFWVGSPIKRTKKTVFETNSNQQCHYVFKYIFFKKPTELFNLSMFSLKIQLNLLISVCFHKKIY